MKKTFGKSFKIEVTGSSHGEFVGGIITNCPKGLLIDYALIEHDLERRKPGRFGTQRTEDDKVVFLSGIKDGITDGNSIEFKILNHNVRKEDYDKFRDFFRPSHADYPYYMKYGEDNLRYKDAASARMFLPIVVAGSIAKIFLRKEGISFNAYVSEIGGIDCIYDYDHVEELLEEVSRQQDTIGGKVRCEIVGVKAGLGEEIFDKISSNLAFAMMTVPSAVNFSLGDIPDRDTLYGSEDIDEWNDDFSTKTNHCGGVNAGLTNGMPIVFTVGFHAVHTLKKEMTLISRNGELKQVRIGGRHDICQVLRTPVIIESLAAMVITDFITANKKQTI
ncbi:MAG: chorismate synthase [Bacteroidales bacterium]|nr:chorismate synthase [Bacteroidales bacterium]